MREPTTTRWNGAIGWAVVFFVVVIGHHLLATTTESINWDEFALLERVKATIRSGRLEGGGRPGLANFPLMPIVHACRDGIEAAVQARILWTIFYVAYLGGVHEVARRASGSSRAALLATAFLACMPVVMRSALQVRTDLPALAFALWAIVAFDAPTSRRAAISGLLYAIGHLCSQKAAYVGLLGAVFVLQRAGPIDRRQAAALVRRIAWAGCSVAVVFSLFSAAFAWLRSESAPSLVSVDAATGAFAFYRRTMGLRAYRAVLPSLAPLVLMVVLSLQAFRVAEARRAVAWSFVTIIAGAAVLLFHAAAFTYFWLTLGLFAAVALAIGYAAVEQVVERRDHRRTLSLALWGLVVGVNLPPAVALLEDTQAVQRSSLAFIDRSLPVTARGFHPEGALLCRGDADPFRTYFSQHIAAIFEGEGGDASANAFIDEFRARPVSFLVESYRLRQFPHAVRRFWDEHYVRYAAAVFVVGAKLDSDRPARTFEVFVPGRYTWLGTTALQLEETRLAPDTAIDLDPGKYGLRLGGRGAGFLTLAMPDPPSATTEPFYSRASMAEFAGGTPWDALIEMLGRDATR